MRDDDDDEVDGEVDESTLVPAWRHFGCAGGCWTAGGRPYAGFARGLDPVRSGPPK